MRNIRVIVITVFLLSSRIVSAQFVAVVEAPTTDSLLSTQITALTQIVAQEQLGNNIIMTEIIPRAKQTIDIANATLDTSRRLYEIGKSIADYSPEKLLRDMKEGFCNGFPGTCPGLESSILELKDNVEMISSGDDKFFSYKSRWNSETNRFIVGLASGMMKAHVYPKVAPLMSKYYGFDNEPTAVDQIYTAALVKSGLASELSFKTVQASMINVAVKDFLDEAQRSKNLTAQGQAIQLGIEQSQARDLETMANIQKAEYVKKELEEEQVREGNAKFLDAYKKRTEEMKKNKELKDMLNTSTKPK